MSIEALNQLEEKVQSAVETLSLYRMEIEELREAKANAERALEEMRATNAQLEEEKNALHNERQSWNDKISDLVSKLDTLTEEEVA